MASAGLSRVHTGPVSRTHPPTLCSIVGSRVLGTRAGTGVHLLSSTGCGAEAACKRVVEAGLRAIIPLCDKRIPKERDTTRSEMAHRGAVRRNPHIMGGVEWITAQNFAKKFARLRRRPENFACFRICYN